jgi:hypothetical protein
VLLGADDRATEWFAAKGLSVSTSTEGLNPAQHVVLV